MHVKFVFSVQKVLRLWVHGVWCGGVWHAGTTSWWNLAFPTSGLEGKNSHTLPHLFHTLCLHYQIAVWVIWREFCSCWPYHYDCVTNGHVVCAIEIPCFHVLYLRHMDKFGSKLVACYTCTKGCQKCRALWAKMKNKKITYLFMSYRCSSYCNSRIWQIVLLFNITVNMQIVTYFIKV